MSERSELIPCSIYIYTTVVSFHCLPNSVCGFVMGALTLYILEM